MAYKYESALFYIADVTAYLQVKAANVTFLLFSTSQVCCMAYRIRA
jgi:hypothetical protein